MNINHLKVSLFSIIDIIRISRIVEACGRNMYAKYGLTHWRNSFIKTFLIIIYSILFRRMTLWKVMEGSKILATYQTKIKGQYLNFAKFAVDPVIEGKGLGTNCLDFMSKLAMQNDLKGLTCEVMAESAHALTFYINRGFKEVCIIKTLNYTELRLLKNFDN